eukprot:TRINITY_DN798_c0_g1_i3.p1 TRINITY_DN798_c0_g1~~TRINITY_DN798_c0_g1_i3.p1  ORF type:complete len:537 (+),score=186.19 TRINITY_DN798_c0_g1_i3:46-1611(+)
MPTDKMMSAKEAALLVKDGDCVAVEGFVAMNYPEEVVCAIEDRFLKTGHPRDLTLFYTGGQGDNKGHGSNHLAHEGLLKRVYASHFGLNPDMGKLIVANKVEAYNVPLGVQNCMLRDISAAKPRTITHIGLGTFVDPRQGGGKLNERTKEELVELIQFDGKDYLSFRLPKINIAIIRGTTADLAGNITQEKEGLTLAVLSMAMAAHNCGGITIAQVERLAELHSLNPRKVKVPGILVNRIVQASSAELHAQVFGRPYSPAFASELRVPLGGVSPLPLDERKIIARRAAMELRPNMVVNLGIGIPDGVGSVAFEEGIDNFITLTTEPGTIGGMPAVGVDFGAVSNMECLLDEPYQFDFYDGGGLDLAVLGLAQADECGNTNVSKFGPKMVGSGGFIDISQMAKKLVFVGTFTASGLKVHADAGKLVIEQDGKVDKFVKQVDQITFAGKVAANAGQTVLYVTERCVFSLTKEGLELVEVAPGVELEKDVLAHMTFRPIIKGQPKLMDPRIFLPETMGLSNNKQ